VATFVSDDRGKVNSPMKGTRDDPWSHAAMGHENGEEADVGA
jgi:hypothetical protein